MALFKVSKGKSENLSNQPLVEGYSWFTPDDGKFYIDAHKTQVEDGTEQEVLVRVPLNAECADKDGEGRNIKDTYSTFYMTIVDNADGTYAVDTSYAQLKEAYDLGRTMYCKVAVQGINCTLPLFIFDGTTADNCVIAFSGSGGFEADQPQFLTVLCQNGQWLITHALITSNFYVNYDSSNNTADKTYSEILAAYNKNMAVFVRLTYLNGTEFTAPLIGYDSDRGVFSFNLTSQDGEDQIIAGRLGLTKTNIWYFDTSTLVPATREINGYKLDKNINLTAADVGALPETAQFTLQATDDGNGNVSLSVGLKSEVEIVTWANGTDEQIVAMVQAADRGEINLSDYWAVGDTRTVHLSAMAATGVGETHAEQDVELVLMHAGEYKLNSAVSSGRDTCSFVVGMKDALAETGYMNSTDTNTGSWDGCARRAWCNDVFKGAIPSILLPIFKQFKTITAETYNGTTLKTSVDWFALAAAKEIFGGTASSAGLATSYSNLTEFNALFQLDWYKTAANRIKKLGKGGSATYAWERSPYYNGSDYFCYVRSGGSATSHYAGNSYALSPFGCI